MRQRQKDSLRQLLRDGSLHIDTFRADGKKLALRTALSLDGDLITKLDPQHATPKLIDRHSRQVRQTLAPIQRILLWIRRLLHAVEHRYFVVGGVSLSGATVTALWTTRAQGFSWRSVAYSLLGSGILTAVLTPVLRKTIQLLIELLIYRAMRPTGKTRP